ncbi:MAG TPA: SipW-dependent-type signal peptide-containing protein [Nocardioides sp.]|nr:SipW-dependent-type signal peptide-containing protein [Nocardioides sp.]
MGSHAAPRQRKWFGRGRTRALLSLGVVALLFVGGTGAYWTDDATVTGGPISTATLDLTAGPTTGAENLNGTGPNDWSSGILGITDLVPNESIAATFVVRNSGTAPLRFNATVATTNNNLTSASVGLQVQVYDNGTTATNTGTQAAGTRSGTCNGTQVYSGYVSTTASAAVYPADIQLTSTGATRNVCVRAWLNSAAGNTLQGKSTQVVLSLSAKQVNAP